ncbi:MAG TPA: AAA family ATPase, partial [Myxococcota bacterium]|nr:AAA family ATPase [Myxococcota bacterium]
MTRPPFLKRCQIRNFRSIAGCDVRLQPLTLLVGPNGAGKSNLLDALRLVADSLQTTLEHALRERGGVEEVRRRSNGHPTHFQIGLELDLVPGSFAFEVGAVKGAFRVTREECVVGAARYVVRDGVVASVVVPDRVTGMPVDTTSRAPGEAG